MQTANESDADFNQLARSKKHQQRGRNEEYQQCPSPSQVN